MKILILCLISIALAFGSCKTKEEDQILDFNLDDEIENNNLVENGDELFSNELKKVDNDNLLGEGDHQYDPTQTLYFSHAFIYEYNDGQDKGEFWIYHNPTTGQLMYMPEDPMVEFIVSDTLGNYYFFGDDGHGRKTVDAQFVDLVANPKLYDSNVPYPISDKYVSIKPTEKTKSLGEMSHVNGKPIVGTEYKWTFNQVSGSQNTFITEMIPVNFYQVYGFNKLEGDIRLPVVDLDFTGIFGKNQVVTYLESENLKMELTFYQFNPAFVEAGDYEYSVQLSDGNWSRRTLPLLTKK